MYQKRIEILLIEDNPLDRQIFQSLVDKMGLDLAVFWVQNLKEANAAISQKNYDLIVTDLGLPDCQGIECLSNLRDVSQGTPIIVLTGSSDERLLEESSQLGVQDYLVKGDLTRGALRRSFRYAISRAEVEKENKRLAAYVEHNQKIEALGRLTGGIAHDFNNKLAIIKGNLQVIKLKNTRKQPIAENLKNIDRTVDIAAELTKQLLAFARKQELSRQSTDLTQVVGQSLQLLRRLTKKNIQIVHAASGESLFAEVDGTQIDQVLMNLLINARDAIGEAQGIIVVEVESIEATNSNPGNMDTNGPEQYVCISVKDNGCGMDERIKEKVLEPFFTTKDKDKGSGLGLAVVDGIISQLGGFMNIESAPGVGTTVQIYLPQTEETSVALPTIVKQDDEQDTESMVVLYAEDEDDLRDLTKILLEDEGFTVLSARNGQEGLQLFKQYQDVIDVVISDAIMPEMGGKEMTSEIRAIDGEMGFVFLSGYSEAELSADGDFPPNTRFLAKPCKFVELVEAVKILGRNKPQKFAEPIVKSKVS